MWFVLKYVLTSILNKVAFLNSESDVCIWSSSCVSSSGNAVHLQIFKLTSYLTFHLIWTVGMGKGQSRCHSHYIGESESNKMHNMSRNSVQGPNSMSNVSQPLPKYLLTPSSAWHFCRNLHFSQIPGKLCNLGNSNYFHVLKSWRSAALVLKII